MREWLAEQSDAFRQAIELVVNDPVWINRRLLLTGADHLTGKQWTRLNATLKAGNPTGEIGAAWGVKERLRMLLAEHAPSRIRWRLADFYDAVLDANTPETTRLGNTIPVWWPAILIALTEQVTNARTEGFIIWRGRKRGVDVADALVGLCGRHVLWSLSVTSTMSRRPSGRPWRDSKLCRSGLRRRRECP